MRTRVLSYVIALVVLGALTVGCGGGRSTGPSPLASPPPMPPDPFGFDYHWVQAPGELIPVSAVKMPAGQQYGHYTSPSATAGTYYSLLQFRPDGADVQMYMGTPEQQSACWFSSVCTDYLARGEWAVQNGIRHLAAAVRVEKGTQMLVFYRNKSSGEAIIQGSIGFVAN